MDNDIHNDLLDKSGGVAVHPDHVVKLIISNMKIAQVVKSDAKVYFSAMLPRCDAESVLQNSTLLKQDTYT